MTAYCDTSFLFSLYAPDANSAAAARQCSGAREAMLITPLCELELTNALELRLFRKELTSAEVAAAGEAFRSDLAAGLYSSHPVSAAVFEKACRLSREHTRRLGCRSLDILHVAAALVSRASVLYTFDENQKRLAAAEGLRTAPARTRKTPAKAE
jgi:predicted nucleic acid-binding protein